METMGLLSDTAGTAEELELDDLERDVEQPAKAKPSIWRRIWPSPDETQVRFLGLPLRWLVVIAIVAVLSIVIICAVVKTVLPRKPNGIPDTGLYSADAPFREVIRTNFPDPALLRHNGTWYVYGTNNAAGILDSKVHGKVNNLGVANIQLATSSDFLNWNMDESVNGPLQELGEWVSKEEMQAPADASVLVRRANVWAPDVLQRADGKFVLYYSATAANEDHIHCIGAAVSNSPTGPFEPERIAITCPVSSGGAIDVGSIVDADGTIYLSYKLDGNSLGNGGECLNSIAPLKDTPIYLQKMEADGVTISSAPVLILDRTEADGPLVEAPSLVRSDAGIYFLFYSSGCTFNPSYKLNYATSPHVTGPYTRASEPLLQTGFNGLYAPGSASVSRDEKGWHMAFHARLWTELGGIRAMYVSNLKIAGTQVTLQAPV